MQRWENNLFWIKNFMYKNNNTCIHTVREELHFIKCNYEAFTISWEQLKFFPLKKNYQKYWTMKTLDVLSYDTSKIMPNRKSNCNIYFQRLSSKTITMPTPHIYFQYLYIPKQSTVRCCITAKFSWDILQICFEERYGRIQVLWHHNIHGSYFTTFFTSFSISKWEPPATKRSAKWHNKFFNQTIESPYLFRSICIPSNKNA